MQKILILAVCVGGFIGCTSTRLSPDAAREQVNKLITLYKENKPKFVVQKQQLEQAEDCGRVTSLREAIDKIAEEAAMSPEDTEVITLVQMELQQAEKTCLQK